MLKREIEYEDFNDQTVKEVLYFNISEPEVAEMEVEHPEGFGAWLQKAIDDKDNKTLLGLFKDLILLAYGEKSEDGRMFVKTPEIRTNFSHTAAFQAIFMDLSTDEQSAADFVKGVLPKKMVEEAEKTLAKMKNETKNVELPESPT